MSSEQLAVRPRASQQLASLIGMESNAMLGTIKAQCFKCPASQVSDAQLAAFVSVAAAMEVNPLLPGMLYAYPTTGGGIVPIMGPDGVYKKLTEHPDIDSWDTEVFPVDVSLPPTHAITRIWRKNRERPISYTAVLSEWKIETNPNWRTRPRHFLALRSLKHAARQIIHGLPYDEDDRAIMNEINVTPETAPVERSDPPPRKAKGTNAAKQQEATKPETPATAASTTVDVAATPVVESSTPAKTAAPVEKVAEKVAEPVADPKPVTPPATEQPPTPRAFLKDGETLETTCVIKSVTAMMGKKAGVMMPSVQAVVSGGFVGTVCHFGGATLQGEGEEIIPLKDWTVGQSIRLALRAKALSKPPHTILVLVDEIKSTEATQASAGMEAE